MFKVNDLVWAKLARYPPWPAIVMPNDPLAPPKHKNSHWIYFFGSHDYAWVEETHLKPFEAYKDQFKATYKQALIQEAVEEMEEIIENKARDPDYQIEFIKYTKKEKKKGKSSESSADSRSKFRSRSRSNSSSKKRKSRSSGDSDSEKEEEPSKSAKYYGRSKPHNPTSISLKTFGFLAANICDEGIIKNLIKSKHRVIVWSSSSAMCEELQDYAERLNVYFRVCNTKREVVRNSDIVYNHMTDPDQIKLLFKDLGVFDEHDTLLDGKGYVEMTGVDPETSLEHCKLIENKGATYLEVMLQGGRHEANRGQLIVLAAGKVPNFNECESCFKAMGVHTFLLEIIGSATKIHMILQVMRGIILAGFAEGISIAEQNGIILEVFQELLDATSMSCDYLKSKGDIIIGQKFADTEEPLIVIQKSMTAIRKISNVLRHPLPLAGLANEIFKHARRLGFDNQDAACVYNRTRY